MNTPPAADSAPLEALPPVPLMPPETRTGDAEFSESVVPPSKPPSAPVLPVCANCGTTLLGPHCYVCGQPVKGMVRHLSSILADAADTILNVDSRIFRTLWPLFARPGFLTNEYFEGRRVRYVTPFRLYFFFSVAAFFLIQFTIDDSFLSTIHIDTISEQGIASALTPQEVIVQRDAVLAKLDNETQKAPGSKWAQNRLDEAKEKIRRHADDRVAYLKKIDEAKAEGKAPPPDPMAQGHINIDGNDWDPQTQPLHVSWLPKFVNDKLTQLAIRAEENVAKLKNSGDWKPFAIAAIGVLPQVLFVLMPLFALMLKVFYIFKHRLYMEHLIVALHSHAFIFLVLFLLVLCSLIEHATQTSLPWLSTVLHVLVILLAWWLPIYLFIMQKKVYKQGWTMTTLKYSMIGISYFVLIAFGAVAALLVGLTTA